MVVQVGLGSGCLGGGVVLCGSLLAHHRNCNCRGGSHVAGHRNGRRGGRCVGGRCGPRNFCRRREEVSVVEEVVQYLSW